MSIETNQLFDLVVKSAQHPIAGNTKEEEQRIFEELLSLIILDINPIKTFEITFTAAEMKTIGFGQTILPPSPDGFDYVLLSGEAFLKYPVAFGQAYDNGGMQIVTRNSVGNWIEFTNFLNQTDSTFHTGTIIGGSKTIFDSDNGDVILTGLNSINGNSPVTVTGTYKLISKIEEAT